MKTSIHLFAAVLAGAFLLAVPRAEASSTNVNEDADDFALSCTWEPDFDCAPGSFSFTASATCKDRTPDPVQPVSISAAYTLLGGAPGSASRSGYNEVTLDLSGVGPGPVNVAFTGADESFSTTVWALKVDIVQEREDHCIHVGEQTLVLTDDSELGPLNADWYWDNVQDGTGRSYSFTPSDIEPCSVTVRAEAQALPACHDTCKVNIVAVDLAAAGCVCVTNGTTAAASRKQIAIDKCDPASWDGHVQLFWAGGGGVEVYTAPSNGVEVTSGETFANANLPTNLWVEGTAPSAAVGDIAYRLNPVEAGCPDASSGCDRATMTAVDARLTLPEVVGVNDLVHNYNDPAGHDKGFVATAAAFAAEDDLPPPEAWGVAPRDDSLGDITVTGDGRIWVLTTEGAEVVKNPSFSPTDTASEFKLEGVDFSMVPGDAIAELTYSVCTVKAATTVVQVELDKFCYNRADPYPEIEITDVAGLVPGETATVSYQRLGDVLDGEQTGLTDTFTVEEAFGTYEYQTPPYTNRLGNTGSDAIRYTVYDNDGTKSVRWSHADPDRKALAELPDRARMKIDIKDALADTPEQALGHLVRMPEFAGEVHPVGTRPSYEIADIKVLAKTPSPAYTNEVHADVGNETILQTLHGVARDSAVVLEISGPRAVGVNDRFNDEADPGDDALEDHDVADPDFIGLTLAGVPGCIKSGTVTWNVTTGADCVRLVSRPDAAQLGATVTNVFAEGPSADLLQVYVEGIKASETTDDVEIRCETAVDDSEDNPLAFQGETLEATFRLTVTDLRWTGWKDDDEAGKTPERTERLVCDLDLRPAVLLEEPQGGHAFEQGDSLAVSGSVRSMTDVVTDIRVNGEPVPLSEIRFLAVPLEGLTSVNDLTDRPPPYVVTFSHAFSQFDADEVRVEARNGVATSPGYAVRRVGYAAATGTVSTALAAAPDYDEPELEAFFDSGWKFLYKTEVDHCGAGAGIADCVETCGAQPGNGLFRLRQPLVFVSEQGLNGALPAPGLLVESGLAEPVEAKYDNGVTEGMRNLFLANLTAEDGGGAVPDAEEWWRGAMLGVGASNGLLRVSNPDHPELPEDAVLSLELAAIGDLPNPFADFETRVWIKAEGEFELLPVEIPLITPTNSGAAAFVLTLSSTKYGLLAKDRIRVGVAAADLDIDSNNDNGSAPPDCDEAEDVIEDDEDEPGKILLVNDNDDDLDGIPDYADGYDLLPADTNDSVTAGERFVPVVFTLSDAIDPSRATVRVTYPASDPGAVATNGAGGYTLPAGSLRLWKRDGGDGTRSTNTVAAGGDFLPSDTACTAEAFGCTNGLRTVIYYAEAVRPSDVTADIRILFEVKPDDRTGFIAADAVRLTAVQMEFIIPDENGGKMPTRFVPVSDPRPVVALADLENEDVDIAGGTASFTISGEVTDAIADIIPDNLADIATVRVLVDGEEFIAPTALAAGDGGAASFWRRHPFKGVFEDLEVEVAAEGSHVVTVETSANAAGSRGQDSLLLSFHSAEEDFFGGTNFVANIYIATNLTNTVADTIQYYHGAGEPYEEDPWLAETAAASLVFTGRLDEVGIEIDISGFSGLTTNVDSFVAEMRFNISTNYQPVYSNLFVETSATSGLFRSASALAVGRGDLTVEVRSLDGSLPGTCVPVVERIKGPADLLGSGDSTLEFMGETFELEAEDGWFYPQGGSPRFWVATDGDLDPENTYLISYEPNGTISKVKQSEAPPEVKLLKSGTALFNIYATLLNIDLKGYEAWRSAERENKEVPRTEEEQPGFLITAKVDAVGGVNPLESKIVAAKLAYTGTGGLTRWLRFSDPTKVALTRDGNPVGIPAPCMELIIDGATTADAAYEICMLDPEAWAADTCVTVEYFIRDKEGRKLPGADKVRLLRPVVIAIGDSLTFGFMRDAAGTNLTRNWSNPWDQYPTTASWSGIEEEPRKALGLTGPAVEIDVDNQGWRGRLRQQLPGFHWAGESANNTSDWSEDGHGPKHCGYSGAFTTDIKKLLHPGSPLYHRQLAPSLQTTPCYAIVIYFIGANDCNITHDTGESIFNRWYPGMTQVGSLRANKGRTLLVGVTIPAMGSHWANYGNNNTKRLLPLNERINSCKLKAPPPFVTNCVADCEAIGHADGFDDGLHFLPSGYMQIQTNILAAILKGLAGGQIAP